MSEVLWLMSLIVYEVLGTVRILHGRHEETGNNHHGIPEKKKEILNGFFNKRKSN